MPRLDTLWYEIDARTQSFDKNILGAKAKLQEFVEYAAKNPITVLGALAVAFGGVAVAATHMANEIDQSLRRVSAAFPLTAKGFEALRKEIDEIGQITPRSHEEIAKAMEEIAQRGVSSVEELSFRLRKAVDIADASGSDLHEVIRGLDNIADAFKISAGQAADELTRIFAAAQGKVALEEVFAVMERGGSVLASLGVKAHEAGEAMVALIDAGIPRRQAGVVLQQIIDARAQAEKLAVSGTEAQKEAAKIVMDNLSATSIAANGFTQSLARLGQQARDLGVSLRDVGINTNELNALNRVGEAAARDHRTEQQKLTDAINKMNDALLNTRGGADQLWQFIKNQLATVMIELGNQILPTVIRGLREMNEILRILHPPETIAKEIQLIEAEERLANARRATSAQYRVDPTVRSPEQLDEILGPTGKGTFIEGPKGVEQEYVAAKRAVIELNEALNAAAKARAEERAAENEGAKDAAAKAAKEAADEKARVAREQAAAVREQSRQAVASMREQALSEMANLTKTAVDDAQAQVDNLQARIAEMERKHFPVPQEARDELTRLKENVQTVRDRESAAAASRIQQIVDQSTVTNVDNLTTALQDLQRELKEIPDVTDADIKKITELQQAVINATGASEEAARRTANVDVTTPEGGMGKVKELLDIQDGLEKLQSKVAYGTAAWKVYDEAIQNVKNHIKQLQDANSGVDTNIEANSQKIQAQARMIDQAAQGAIQLAEAFGIVDQAVGKVLQSISQIATGIGPLIDQIQRLRAGTGGAGAVVGAALPVIGGIASLVSGLFGKSPEEIERQRLMKENTNALRDLSKNVGDLARINVTGTQLGQVQRFLAAFEAANIGIGKSGFTNDQINRQIGAILDSFHMSAEELKKFAEQFGVAIGTGGGGKITAQDIENLKKAMETAEITQFAHSFSGQMQQLNAEIQLFDLSKPIDQFEAFRRAIDRIAGGGGALGKMLQQFDLTTSEGLQKAQEALQQLFQQMQAGTLTAEDLGGMSPQDFLNAILQLQGILKAQGATPELQGTGGFNVSREITEVTGSRLAALLMTSNTFLEKIAADTAILAGTGFISPPTFTPTATLGGDTYNVTINLPEGSIPQSGDPTEIGDQIGQAFLAKIGRGMGREAKLRMLTRGQALRA